MSYRIHYPPGKLRRQRAAARGAALLEGIVLGCAAAALLTAGLRAAAALPPAFTREQAVAWAQEQLLEAGYAP